jgi:hypothetical protein
LTSRRTQLAAVISPIVFLAIEGWIRRSPDSGLPEQLAIGLTGLFFLTTMVGVVRPTYEKLKAQELNLGKTEALSRFAARAWIHISCLGLPATITFALALGAAAPGTGLNATTARDAPSLVAIGATTALAVLLAGTAAATSRPPPPRVDGNIDPTGLLYHRVSASTTTLVLAATLTLAAGPFLSAGAWPAAFTTLGGSILLALAVAVVISENVAANASWLHVVRPTRTLWALSSCCGLGAGVVTFWILAALARSRLGPFSSQTADEALVIGLLGTAMVVILCGLALARALPAAPLTLHAPAINLVQDQLVYAAVIYFLLAIPMFLLGEIEAGHVYALLALVALPIAALILRGHDLRQLLTSPVWVITNNNKHLVAELRRTSDANTLAPRTVGGLSRAWNEDARRERLVWHVLFHIWSFVLVLAAPALIVFTVRLVSAV